MGESGGGKSTLLRLLAGLEESDAGNIELDGERVPGPNEQLVPGHPAIRLAHQDGRLFPNLTVTENIAYALRFRGRSERLARTQELIQLLDLTPVSQHKPRQLSGGEAQRTVLARALAEETPVLLLDEPFGHLDVGRRERLKGGIMANLRQGGPTVVLVTHDPVEALTLADRIAVLHQGLIVQVDSPENVYRRPGSPAVAELLGPANLVTRPALQQALPGYAWPSNLPANAWLCLRPEELQLAAIGQEQGFGVVQRVAFRGAGWEVEVELPGGIRWLLYSDGGLPLGETVGLRATAGWVFPGK